MKTKSRHKGISRIVNGKSGGWFARVYFRKKTYSKLFSDSVYGSKAMALTKAIQWRDKTKRELEYKYWNVPVEKKARSNTGVVGVTRTHKNGKPCYSVSWQAETGKQKCKTFSVDKYGEEESFRLACQWRQSAQRM